MAKICPNPECGFKSMEEDDVFCPECRMRLVPEESVASSSPHPSVGAAVPGGAFIGEGARLNVTGGISQTTHMQQDFNGAKIDVYQKERKEFCESCGKPFGERHARCPECGKEICFDCLVKEKNRCKKCEKNAREKYQSEIQQALLMSKGKINVTLRQMMDRKADELNVENVKEELERKALELYQSVVKAEQPEVIPMAIAAVATAKSQEDATTRGIGALSGDTLVTPKSDGGKKNNNNGGASMWAFIVFLIVVVGAAYFLMSGGDEAEKSAESVQQVEQSAESQPASQPVQQVRQTPATEKQADEPVQPAVKRDTNYEAGMKAYDAGNGLEAISAFKKSGSAKAYYMLGVIYENGCGNVDKNPMLARKNFKKAADMGNAEAKAKL